MNTNSTPILQTKATTVDSSLWFGRAALYPDRIVLTGWSWTGRVRRTFPLDQVDVIETWSHSEGANVRVHFDDGERQSLRLKESLGLWYWQLKELDVDVQARS